MALEAIRQVESSAAMQRLRGDTAKLSSGCVLLGILKSIETELRKRNHLITTRSDLFTPLWFLAETERNIFLWRSNQGLDDARRYTFWVDIPALIEKRREQLSKPERSNPFTNPTWGSTSLDTSLIEQERDYLDALEDLLPTAFRQAETLSRASEALRLEMDPQGQRSTVVIPR